jgi:hypothetical protein
MSGDRHVEFKTRTKVVKAKSYIVKNSAIFMQGKRHLISLEFTTRKSQR